MGRVGPSAPAQLNIEVSQLCAFGPYEPCVVPSFGYVLQEPTPRAPLDTVHLVPLLQSNALALAALDPPIKHPLSLLSYLTSLPPPTPYALPSGDVLHPPPPSGTPPRKIVIFGDCTGGTRNERFQQMCEDASLLIHECTDGAIPELIQRGTNRMRMRKDALKHSLVRQQDQLVGETPGTDSKYLGPSATDVDVNDAEGLARHTREKSKKAEVRQKALSRGHSTPEDVGKFARAIRARRVVVNHFSAK